MAGSRWNSAVVGIFATFIILALAASGARAQDVVEKVNGQKIRGEVIGQTADKVTVRMTMGGSSVEMGFKMKDVHAITIDGDRKEYNPKRKRKPRKRPAPRRTAKRAPVAFPRQKAPKVAAKPTGPAPVTRTQAEVRAYIQQQGTAKPDWWSSASLNYPKTLDLSFAKQQGKGWFPQKNVAHYMHSVINENPRRWFDGTKFMHYVLSLNKAKGAAEKKCYYQLGHCYRDLLRDWARGAYWWQKADDGRPHFTIGLAECYLKLGNKAMAAQRLSRITTPNGNGTSIKLWADMGEIDKAMQLASRAGSARRPDGIYVAAGDACRKFGRYPQAIDFYQKVLAIPDKPKDNYLKMNKGRSRSGIQAIKVFETLDMSKVRNGTYSGRSTGFGGELGVSVTVQSGKIVDVRVTRQTEKQSFTSLRDTPKRILAKQGLKGVDATTGATVSSEGIINATADALSKGMR